MSVIWVFVLFAAGILLIVKGGDAFVDASVWIAERTGIPRMVIGATLVSLATTLPEMLVSLLAAVQGKIDMSAGNAVGSATANAGLILAISIIASAPSVSLQDFAPKGLLLILSSALLFSTTRNASLSPFQSMLLLAVLGLFLYQITTSARSLPAADAHESLPVKKREILFRIFQFASGAAGIAIGAQLLVDKGSTLASLAGVPDGVIGATFIAVGTSLPEFITLLAALRRGEASLSIGNIIGANIIDLTLILPLCCLITGENLPLSSQNAFIDIPFGMILTLIAVVPTLLKQRFCRLQGVLLLAAYSAYIAFLII